MYKMHIVVSSSAYDIVLVASATTRIGNSDVVVLTYDIQLVVNDRQKHDIGKHDHIIAT